MVKGEDGGNQLSVDQKPHAEGGAYLDLSSLLSHVSQQQMEGLLAKLQLLSV